MCCVVWLGEEGGLGSVCCVVCLGGGVWGRCVVWSVWEEGSGGSVCCGVCLGGVGAALGIAKAERSWE